MNAFAKYDQFDDLRKRYPNARLKLKATIDGRERTQSREMNGQISNAKGEFLYPDAKFYRLGTAPAQWSINDRETCYIVFLDNKEVKENREELRQERETARNINKEDAKLFKEIDNQSLNDVANIQEVKEIENKIKEIGEFIGKVDLTGVPLDLAKDIYLASNKVFSKYPQLKKQTELFLSLDVGANFADNLSNIGSIRLNPKYYSNINVLKKEYDYSVILNVHPKNTDYNAIILHEYGHSLGEYIVKNKGITKLQLRNEVLKRAGYKPENIAEKLSNSATISASEFFAEAFAEYLNSPKPRKLAKEFGKYISELLN